MNGWTLALDPFLITCAQEASDESRWLLSTSNSSCPWNISLPFSPWLAAGTWEKQDTDRYH
jgi:hypothetical protein